MSQRNKFFILKRVRGSETSFYKRPVIKRRKFTTYSIFLSFDDENVCNLCLKVAVAFQKNFVFLPSYFFSDIICFRISVLTYSRYQCFEILQNSEKVTKYSNRIGTLRFSIGIACSRRSAQFVWKLYSYLREEKKTKGEILFKGLKDIVRK